MRRAALRFSGVQAEDRCFGAIRDATFTLYCDEAILLTGLFNSGLATLPRLLNGEVREFGGEICVYGRRLTRISPETAEIAVIGRRHLLLEDMTLADGIRMRCGRGRLGIMRPLRCSGELLQLLEVMRMDLQTPAQSPFERIKHDILAAYAAGARAMAFTDMELYCNNEEYLELENILLFLKEHGVALMIIVINDSLWRYTCVADRCLVMRAGILTTVVEKGPDGLFDEDEIHHVAVGRRFLPLSPHGERQRQRACASRPARFVLCPKGGPERRIPLTPGSTAGLYDSDSRLPATIEAFVEALNGPVCLMRDGVRFLVKTPRDLANGGMAVILNASAEKLIFQNLSPAENIAFFAQHRLHSVLYGARLSQYLFDSVIRRYSFFRCGDALRGRRDCYGLSYEQLFELMVAKWLAANPDAVILFTALSNEDIKLTERFRDLQRELTGRGKAVLLISADYDRLERDCGEIYEI